MDASRRLLTVTAASVLITTLTGAAHPAAAAAPGGSRVTTEAGTRLPDGACRFSGRLDGAATGPARVLVLRELSVDRRACSRRLARTERPAGTAATSLVLPPQTRTTSDKAALPAPGSPGGPWSGSLTVRVADPANVAVTTAQSSLTWRSDGTYLYADHTSRWDWLLASGWSAGALRHDHRNDGTTAYTDTAGNFTNTLFCDPRAATYVEHRRTYFAGRSDGRWTFAYDVTFRGDCSELLHSEYVIQTP